MYNERPKKRRITKSEVVRIALRNQKKTTKRRNQIFDVYQQALRPPPLYTGDFGMDEKIRVRPSSRFHHTMTENPKLTKLIDM